MGDHVTAAPIVRFEGVNKAFGEVVVFRDLSLDVRVGEVLTVVGASGCGKSVLLKMILGLVRWDGGRLVVDGEDISDRSEEALLDVRRKVGMLFQGGALFDSLSVRENIAYPLRERGVRDEKLISTRVAEVLEMVGLPGTEHREEHHG